MPYEFWMTPNQYLGRSVAGFFHANYVGYRNAGNPDYINVLKNTYNSYSRQALQNATQQLETVLREDVANILTRIQRRSLAMCVVPRAKAESSYHENQLLFKATARRVVRQLQLEDGCDYVFREINTRTTHLPSNTPNYNNDGELPYPGITLETCKISGNVKGKEILLVDDVYTRGVNIDEDVAEALLASGAKSVWFYAIGYTD